MLLISITLTVVVYAQHSQGDINLSVGLGIAPTYGVSGGLPISLSGELGITNDISVGGYLSFSTASKSFLGGKWNYSFFILGTRGSYHFLQSEKLDPYAGLMLGYIIASSNWTGDDVSFNDSSATSGVGWSLYGGARYKINDKISAFGELGYGTSVLRIGINLLGITAP